MYGTEQEARAALVTWCRAAGLLPSLVVSSGAGLHVYFVLDRDVPVAEWKPVAEALKRKALADGLRIDPAVTGDAARVLRPVGTLHHSGKRVSVLKQYEATHTLESVKALVTEYLLPASKSSRATRPLNDEVIGTPWADRGPASYSAIKAECAVVRHAAETGGATDSRDVWRAQVGLAKHCKDPEKHAVEVSEGHPTYEPAMTAAAAAGWTKGPPTCETLSQDDPKACDGCKHRGKIKSPISLGYITADAADVAKQKADPAQDLDSAAELVDESSALAAMNQRYFVGPDGAGKPTIFYEWTDPEQSTVSLVALSRAELGLAHANEFVTMPAQRGGTRRVLLADYWLSHPQRRQYPGGVALLPEGPCPTTVYNLWRGFDVAPVAGDVAPMRDHIAMLCDGVAVALRYVIGWLAFCIQHPGQRPEVSLILQGDEGTGKGTVFRPMVKLFGAHGLHITQNSHLVGHFNAHLRRALFVFVDEGYWAGDKAAEGVLKALVTEPTIAIEGKGRDVYSAPNRMSVGMATNHAFAVPAGPHARRWCVIQVPPTAIRDFEYFKRLNAWIDNGGAAAWMHYLLHYDLTDFNVRDVPSTAALDRQKLATLAPLDRWLLEALDQGTSPAGHGDWTDAGLTLVCRTAVAACSDYYGRAGGRWGQADARVIGTRLAQLFDCGPSKTVQDGSAHAARAKAWCLPGLQVARTKAAAAWGLQHHEWSAYAN